MKKKILVVLLMLSCLTAYCASGEQFFDREVLVGISFHGTKKQAHFRSNWKQGCWETLYGALSTNDDFMPIEKLPNNDIQRINKALQRYEVEKDEIYRIITVGENVSGRGCPVSVFLVLITGKNHWDWIGATYTAAR